MAKLNYIFNLPIPKYFWDHDWFKPELNGRHLKRLFFMQWCLNRCSYEKRTVFFAGRWVDLDPFEFIFGRDVCHEETLLSHKEIRNLIDLFSESNFLIRRASKSCNKFSVYKYSTDKFSLEGQQSGHQSGQQKGQQNINPQYNLNEEIEKSGPAKGPAEGPAEGQLRGHNLDDKNIDYKKMDMDGLRVRAKNKIFDFKTLDEEMKEMLFFKKNGNIESIEMKIVEETLIADGYSLMQIKDAVSTFREKSRVVRSDIFSYLATTIKNKNKENYARDYASKNNPSKFDPVQRSKESFTAPFARGPIAT